jgi:hypothetical protein
VPGYTYTSSLIKIGSGIQILNGVRGGDTQQGDLQPLLVLKNKERMLKTDEF